MSSPSSTPPNATSPIAIKNRKTRKLLAGGLAGAVTKTIIAPIERVRIMCQTGATEGLFSSFRSIYKEESIRGFWRGNGVTILRIIPNKACLFASNDVFKECFKNLTLSGGSSDQVVKAGTAVLAGSAAGLVTVAATYPLDLIRGRLTGTRASISHYNGIIGTIRTTFQEGGVVGFYRGCAPALAGSLPYEGIKFGTYDFIMRKLSSDLSAEGSQNISLLTKMTAGAIAGTMATVILYPNDTVRRVMQVNNKSKYAGPIDCYRKLWKEFGFRGFWRGLPAQLIRVVPNHAIQFGCYEMFTSLLGVQYQVRSSSR